MKYILAIIVAAVLVGLMLLFRSYMITQIVAWEKAGADLSVVQRNVCDIQILVHFCTDDRFDLRRNCGSDSQEKAQGTTKTDCVDGLDLRVAQLRQPCRFR